MKHKFIAKTSDGSTFEFFCESEAEAKACAELCANTAEKLDNENPRRHVCVEIQEVP